MTRRTFTFKNGHHVTCDTAEHAYANGLETGRGWTDKYRPGGPWIPKDNSGYSDLAWTSYCAAMAENNAQWLEGFDDGRLDAELKRGIL